MQAGELRERITIRRRTDTRNDRGGLIRSWSDLATVRARIRSLNGREAVIGQVLQGVSHFEIVIRYRTDVEPSYQVKWSDRELNVHSAEDREGTRQWLTIHASTEAPQGA